MLSIFSRLLVLILAFLSARPALSQTPFFSVTFEEGTQTPSTDPIDNRFLAKVTVRVITNTPSGPTNILLQTFRGSTLPDQLWRATPNPTTFPTAKHLESLQKSDPSIAGASALSNVVIALGNAYTNHFAIIEQGTYDLLRDPTLSRLIVGRRNWIPTLNPVSNQSNKRFADDIFISTGSGSFGAAIDNALTIHPDQWVDFYALFPQNGFAGSVTVKRLPGPPSPPTSLRLINQ